MRTSVIIPTLNEESCLAGTLDALRAHQPYEILVADGGSSDATCAIAASADRLLHAPRGRSAQMNHGALHATGDAFLFLHADCTLETGAFETVARCLSRRRVVAGCFRMRVSATGLAYRAIDGCATARVALTGFVYGDQGLFLTRETFARAGGFPAVRFMEDVMISKSLRRLGRIVVAPKRIYVSPRRWQHQGIIRQTLRNWSLTALAAAGVDPDHLAGYYPAVR